MTYEGREAIDSAIGTREWFHEVDQRFLNSAFYARGDDGQPFGRFLRPELVRGKATLEVGCGIGTHAALLARAGAELTAIDLTQFAVDMTQRRLHLEELPGTILRADAENLPFSDSLFDVVWSWGVLHHTSSFDRAFAEGDTGPAPARPTPIHGISPTQSDLLRTLRFGARCLDGTAVP